MDTLKAIDLSWVAAVALGMLFVNTGWYVGPGAKLFNDADLGFIVSTSVGALLYTAFLKWHPEPAYVFGPEGARIAAAPPERYGDYMPIQEMDLAHARRRIG